MSELADTLQKYGEAFESFKKANDQRITDLEKTGVELSDHKFKLDLIEKDLGELENLKSQLEKLELRQEMSSFEPNGGEKATKEQVEHAKAFEDYVRSVKQGDRTGDQEKLQNLVEREKAVSIGSATAGGHAVPEVIARQIDAKLLDVSEMLPLVKTVTVGTSDYKELVDTKGMAYGWVGETGTRNETGTPSLQQVAPTMGIIYAYPKATEESMQDIFFNVQSWLIDSAVEGFDVGIGNAIIAGDGSNKPTGFLNGTPVDIADDGASPERAFGTLQYIPTGTAGGLPPGFDSTASPQGGAQGDFLYDTVYSLKKGYRGNARFLMNKSTLGAVRKFRDAEGQYLWTPGLQAGQSGTLVGYPVSEMEDMPDIGSNTFPIAFGDFRAGYTFVMRAGMSLTIDDNITQPGYVKFYVRKRVGGILRNDDAIKVVKCAAS